MPSSYVGCILNCLVFFCTYSYIVILKLFGSFCLWRCGGCVLMEWNVHSFSLEVWGHRDAFRKKKVFLCLERKGVNVKGSHTPSQLQCWPASLVRTTNTSSGRHCVRSLYLREISQLKIQGIKQGCCAVHCSSKTALNDNFARNDWTRHMGRHSLLAHEYNLMNITRLTVCFINCIIEFSSMCSRL